jgi:CRP/FNR family putative post-exponential-phase nitrogen-starvation transcriptional regulator
MKNGRRSILDFVGKGDWLGELSLFRQEDYIKENKVIEDVVCLEFEQDRFKTDLQREGRSILLFCVFYFQ